MLVACGRKKAIASVALGTPLLSGPRTNGRAAFRIRLPPLGVGRRSPVGHDDGYAEWEPVASKLPHPFPGESPR